MGIGLEYLNVRSNSLLGFQCNLSSKVPKPKPIHADNYIGLEILGDLGEQKHPMRCDVFASYNYAGFFNPEA